MLDFFQKGGIGKWILIVAIIAVIAFVIYKQKKANQTE